MKGSTVTRSGNGAPKGDLVRAAILGLLGTRGPSSRAVIARTLGISPATVTQTTKDLLARELVTELESVPSKGGRPAILLGLVRDAGGAIGAKVMTDHVALVSVGLDGAVTASNSVDFDASSEHATDRLVEVLGAAIEAHDGHLLGVGVGLPGAVDSQESGVVDAPTLGWKSRAVGQRLRDALTVPVLVDNDVNTLAAAESLYGLGREHRDYIVVTIGRGIGCGIVQDGAVSRGANGGAGEIGHIPVTDDGPVCGCGNTGCLEAHVGEAGLVELARRTGVIGPRGTLATLARAAEAGDLGARDVYAGVGAVLGRALAGVVHVVDPELVIITGEGVSAWAAWEPGFEPAFRRHLIPSRRETRYVVEQWSDDQWARGAACLVLATPFTDRASGGQGDLVRQRLQSPVGIR